MTRHDSQGGSLCARDRFSFVQIHGVVFTAAICTSSYIVQLGNHFGRLAGDIHWVGVVCWHLQFLWIDMAVILPLSFACNFNLTIIFSYFDSVNDRGQWKIDKTQANYQLDQCTCFGVTFWPAFTSSDMFDWNVRLPHYPVLVNVARNSLTSRYTPFDPEQQDNYEDEDFIDIPETTTIFTFCNFQYIMIVIAYSISYPFRKPLWTNSNCGHPFDLFFNRNFAVDHFYSICWICIHVHLARSVVFGCIDCRR